MKRCGMFLRVSAAEYKSRDEFYGITDESKLCERCVWLWDNSYRLDPFNLIHIPNEGERSLALGAKMRRMGLRKGVADYMVLKNGRLAGWMEFKWKSGDLTDEQREFAAKAKRDGVPFVIIRRVEEFILALKEWGIIDKGE